MARGTKVFGVIWLLFLAASSVNGQIIFEEGDYTLLENQDPTERQIRITKSSGTNVGNIIISLSYETLAEYIAQGRPTDNFDLSGLVSANTSGVDFLPTPSSVTIPPSAGLFTAEFLTAILNDDIHEAVEGYFIIGQFSFENTDDEARFGTSPIITALVRIANDDEISVGFQDTQFTLEEDSGSVDVIFGKLNGVMSEVPIVVMVAFSNPLDGIIQGSDFTLDALNETSPATFVFAPSDTSFSINLTVLDDLVLEDTETFSLIITKNDDVPGAIVDGTRGTSDVTINDNEVINFGFAQTVVTVSEGVSFAVIDYQVMLGNVIIGPEVAGPNFGSQIQLQITNGTAGANADFMATDSNILLTHNSLSDTVVSTPSSAMVMILDDDIPEGTEELNLALTLQFGFPRNSAFNISVPLARIIIQDNDATSSVIGLSQSVYNTSEDLGFVEICVLITEPSDLNLLADDYQANLTLSLVMDTAEEGSDYASFTQDFTLTKSLTQQCFNITIEDDLELEILEWFTCTLESVGSLPQEASLGLTEARINIVDNEIGVVGFQPENVTVTEGNDAFAIITVLFLSPATISSNVFTQLSIFTMDGTAIEGDDYQEVSITVTLMGGSTQSDIMVPIVDDVFAEDTENLSLVLSVIDDSGNIGTYAPDTASITILDIDVPASVVVGLEREIYSVNENGGQVEICAAILDPITNQRLTPTELQNLEPSFDASLNFSLTEISALAGVDYSDLMMVMFSLTPLSAFQCFDVPIINDNIFELDEYFNASISLNGALPAGATLGITEARVRIEDDEVGVIGFRRQLFSVNESVGDIKLYVEFISPDNVSSDVEVEISLSTVNDTALGGIDFDEERFVFTLRGVTTEVFDFNVTIRDDTIVERPESENFDVLISSSSSLIADGRLSLNPNRAVITVVDNDVLTQVVIGIERSMYNVSEGDGVVEVCVAIVEPLAPFTLQDTYVATLNLATANNTAFAGEDYGAQVVTFSLSPSFTRQCFNITITDDDILEIPEDFFGNLVLEDPQPPATSLGISQTRITILDNENGVIGFENIDVVRLESDGFARLTVALLSPAIVSSDVSVTLSISTADGTAFDGQDYQMVSTTLPALGAGVNSTFVDVVIINDTIAEVPTRENLTATLALQSSNVPVTLNPSTATITIIDDDNVTRIGFQQDVYTTMEGDGVLQICAAVLDPADPNLIDPSLSVDVRIQLENGAAIAPGDYLNLDQLVQFTENSTVQCVNVTIVDDLEDENAEDFTARLVPDGTLPATVTLSPATSTITILDNEVPSMIGFEEITYTVQEDGGSIEICAAILSPADPTTLPSSYSASINISTVPGTALAPYDFETQSGSFVLTPTMTRACINVPIEDDMILEVNELFSGTLVGVIPPTASLGPDFTTITIRDNEMGVIGILNRTLAVREDVGTVTVYTGFTQPDEISSDIIVDITFSTADSFAMGTVATAGEDYLAVRESFTLQQGMTIRGVPITILQNPEIESTESFLTRIESDRLPDRVILNPATGTISITDIPFPTVTVSTLSPTISPTPSFDPTNVIGSGDVGMGGDPHYSIMLPTGQLLCFSVHGEKDFPFNLISNNLLQMNAFFIEDAKREEITWIGSLGVVVQHSSYKKSNTTKIRFEAKEQMIYINNGVSLLAKRVERLTLAKGKLTITEGLRRRGNRKPEVEVDLEDIGLHFTVRFVKKRHLDMIWRRVELQSEDSHGFIGQFLRRGVTVDETRKLLILPAKEPVPVMRSSVWHFMERERPEPGQQYCWQTMNPGYQGKGLIEGTYLDYLVDDVLSSNFKFSPKTTET